MLEDINTYNEKKKAKDRTIGESIHSSVKVSKVKSHAENLQDE